MRHRRWIAGVIAAVYAAGAATLVLWPVGEQVRRLLLRVYWFGLTQLGVPSTVTADDYATLANALLFTPLTLALVLLVGRRWALIIGLVGALLGFAAEHAQATLGLARVAELDDGLLNGAGAIMGTLAGVLVDRWFDRRLKKPAHQV